MRAVRVLFRCDGGGPLGVGHLVRSLALVEELRASGHEAVVAGHFEGGLAQRLLAHAAVPVVPLPAPRVGEGVASPATLLEQHRADVLHLDHYGLSPGPAARLRAELPPGTLLSSMEEGAFGRRAADVVIDPTLGAQDEPRPDDGSTWLLQGSGYAAMRESVRAQRGSPREHPPTARRVLVLMGGTDPLGLTPMVVRALVRTGLPLEVTAVTAPAHLDAVRAAASGTDRLTLEVLEPAVDLPALFASHDLVVSAAGTTVWELCCVGAPMALVRAVANQHDGYARVVAAGAAAGLGDPADVADPARTGRALRDLLLDRSARRQLAASAAEVVDGLGGWRIVRAWEHALTHPAPPTPEVPPGWAVRPATPQDAELLWQWRQEADPLSSRSGRPVTWPEHVDWLSASLRRSDRVLLVVSDGDGDVGTVRWDQRSRGCWEVSITVAPQRRGQGLSRGLLAAGEATLSRGRGVTAYLAVVHEGNEPSRRLFARAGYLPDLPADQRGFAQFRRPGRVPAPAAG